MNRLYTSLTFLTVFLICTFLFPASAEAQRRDYLTDAEIELVRDAQDIDARIGVLTRAIERRFLALSVSVSGTQQKEDRSDKWGEPPTGSRLELLSDIKQLLQKAIDDIDNTAAHATSPKEAKTKAEKKEAQRFPNAVRDLAAAATRFLPALRQQLDQAGPEKERGTILASIEFCDQIIEASGKIKTADAAEKKN